MGFDEAGMKTIRLGSQIDREVQKNSLGGHHLLGQYGGRMTIAMTIGQSLMPIGQSIPRDKNP